MGRAVDQCGKHVSALRIHPRDDVAGRAGTDLRGQGIHERTGDAREHIDACRLVIPCGQIAVAHGEILSRRPLSAELDDLAELNGDLRLDRLLPGPARDPRRAEILREQADHRVLGATRLNDSGFARTHLPCKGRQIRCVQKR